MTLYFAVSDAPEPFDAETHSRQDLGNVLELTIAQRESEYAIAEMRVQNPKTALANRWLHISEDGKHLFHGELSPAPRGTVGAAYYLDAVARPADAETQKAALAESLKTAPGWDALFATPQDDLSDVLAGHGLLPAWDRKALTVSTVDPIGTAPTLDVVPLRGSLDVQSDDTAPASASMTLTAEWRQLNTQVHDVGGRIGRFETLTHKGLVSGWPRAGQSLGGGYRVLESELVERERDREDLTSSYDLGVLAFDPEWEAAGNDPAPAQKRVFEPRLVLEHQFEVRRTETATVTLEAGVQPVIRSDETESEEVKLNDITATSSASPWQPETNYQEGDQVVDGGRILQARRDHFSGDRLNASDWQAIGETSYISSRRVGSFFKTERGQAALAHAAERLKARLRFAARSVLVSCETGMPDPDALTHDTVATVSDPSLVGGSVTGRVVDYALTWANGRRSATLTVACAAGTGGTGEPTLGEPTGAVPTARSRVDVSLEAPFSVQEPAYAAGDPVPETVLRVEPGPAPAADFEQSVEVPVTGTLAIPQQVTLV